MLQISPYLVFGGNCQEAMTFYQDCFGGELTMQTMADTPMKDQMPAHTHGQILHAVLQGGDFTLMGSDAAAMREPVSSGSNSVAMSVVCSSDEQITTLYDKLLAGGTVLDPLAMQFWGAKFACVEDRFQKRWMLNFDAEVNA